MKGIKRIGHLLERSWETKPRGGKKGMGVPTSSRWFTATDKESCIPAPRGG